MHNRLYNAKNPWQGDAKKVLCVCSAGLLRSPTAARVLAEEYNYNTRAAGIDTEHALIPVDDALLFWADEIVCMNHSQVERLKEGKEHLLKGTEVVNLNIPDDFGYMDPKLVAIIKEQYAESLDDD